MPRLLSLILLRVHHESWAWLTEPIHVELVDPYELGWSRTIYDPFIWLTPEGKLFKFPPGVKEQLMIRGTLNEYRNHADQTTKRV
jgi:hypothetical protein